MTQKDMADRYINGFMAKCAEHGVDGRAVLMKLAKGEPKQEPKQEAKPAEPKHKVAPQSQKVNDFFSGGLEGAKKNLGQAGQWIGRQYGNARNYVANNPITTGTAGGAGMGVLAGLLVERLMKKEKRNYLRGALIGAGSGTLAGAGLGYGLDNGVAALQNWLDKRKAAKAQAAAQAAPADAAKK